MTAFFWLVRQPFRRQRGTHSVMPRRRYWESVDSTTRQGRVNRSSPSMAAMSSMRLFVVSGSAPDTALLLLW